MKRILLLSVSFACAAVAGPAVAAPPPATTAAPAAPAEDGATVRAREAFVRGAEFIKNLQYADALASFELSASLRPHAATTYNVGACLRALGKYTLARKRLREALDADRAAGGAQLSDTLREEAQGFIDQIDRLLATAQVTLQPADAAIALDGAPLEVGTGADGKQVLVAGTRAPAAAEAPPSAAFTMVLDPGAHVLTIARKGFSDAVVNRAFAPGSVTRLDLVLDRLPATIHLDSEPKEAVVSVDDLDVGVAPVDLLRPAGPHHVLVRMKGFLPYEAKIDAHAGERVDLMANLKQDKPALTQRWWFWVAAGVVVAGAAAGTYFATRPPPERPPLNGGGLGWTVQAP